ncbi:MAG: sigma-54 dependent transcriptional regulator [Proteobacteria bacterium]|nr:sigma-54 dependent transcriptional regulator [Pseudomonadota bacterium]
MTAQMTSAATNLVPTTSTAATSGSTGSQTPSPAEYLQYAQERSLAEALFLAADDKMVRIKDIVEQIKEAAVPVLISGESGTGKEVIARAIHAHSVRRDQPFVAVNCAALPANLLESELFGHEKGSFTGAHQRHVGKFEQATNGTLLLDEVTEMDTALQAKLLRALQEREIERIGGSGPVAINTRIIATTNRDITAAVSKGQFRQDLYYRLHVIQLEVPALRERPKDIEILATHFLRQYCQQFAKTPMELTNDARAKLRSHSWPGNVRELQNVIQRAVLLTAGAQVTAAHLPIEVDHRTPGIDWVTHLPIGRPLRDLETKFILETLRHHQGNRTHAAKTLGISLRTLRNKINEFTSEGIEVTAPVTGRAS